jgi:hypothetical protein
LFATYVAVPTFVMLPAVYPSSAAPIVGPPSGVNAVEMTVATHPDPAAALRASLTCTWPSAVLSVPPATELVQVPSEAVTGTVIERAPPTTVSVTPVAAVAGEAGAALSTPPSTNAPTIAQPN